MERTLFVGRSSPASGKKAGLLAARLVTRTDRRKERMRRDMGNKVEIG